MIKNKQNDGRSQAGVEIMLKKIQDERAILDAPLTNRVLLLAAAHIGEVIRCAVAKEKYHPDSLLQSWNDLQNELFFENRETIRSDAEWLLREVPPDLTGAQ